VIDFGRDFFPNAQLVADKFHVLRLVQPAIYRYLKQLELGREALPLYKLLRRNLLKLSPELRWRVRTWLADKPALRELWAVKEALNRLYRVRGRDRAKRALAALTDSMAFSTLPELQTLRRTLVLLAQGNPGLLLLPPDQRPDRGLQRQGKARD